jgi:4-hydroxythreonine-4-phosphate dehydrogenase
MNTSSALVITPGEPAGIGPDLIIKLCQKPIACPYVVVADPYLIEARAQQLNLPVSIQEFSMGQEPVQSGAGCLQVMPVKMAAECVAGKLDPANAPYVLETLEQATSACLTRKFVALVTGPINKSCINEAGIPFSGHTEWLANRTRTSKVVMMLATEGLKVALVTTHLPLSEVPEAISITEVQSTIRILHGDLKKWFGVKEPRITVCGLNPHAGEGGYLGREEVETIEPALDGLRQEGFDLSGPIPADTVFSPGLLMQTDAVLAMYHDQGLPVLKHKGFGKAVNITLGLPIIRTSVDHGTALDLAGKGTASIGSLETAISYAAQMASVRHPD